MNYAVGHNQPGYLPEEDPWIVKSLYTAKDMLYHDLLDLYRDWGSPDYPDDVRDYEDALNAVKVATGPITVYANGWNWWIEETDQPVSDPDIVDD